MRKVTPLLVAIVLSLAVGRSAFAQVEAIYDPATGNVQIQSDRPNLAVVLLQSLTEMRLGGASTFPNTDAGDAPAVLTFFDVPMGLTDLGPVANAPANGLGDLYLSFFQTFGGTSVEEEGTVRLADAPPIPEPATMVLAGMGVLGLAAARRRMA